MAQGTTANTLFCSLSLSCVWLFAAPWIVAHQAPLSNGHSASKNTGVGCHALLQGIFPTQRSNPGLLLCRQIHQLSRKGSPRTLEWVAYPFSRGSSRPRNPTRVSCTAGGFFTSWTTMEVQSHDTLYYLMFTCINSISYDATILQSINHICNHLSKCWLFYSKVQYGKVQKVLYAPLHGHYF